MTQPPAPPEHDPSEVARQASELLARVALGDDRAFAAFYDLMAPRLYGLVLRILNDRKEAEDVLQESFLHVWTHAKNFDRSRSSATTWLYMIFRNKAVDCLRARTRRDVGLRSATEQAPPPEVADGAAAIDQREHAGTVRSALSVIPDDQREAIRLAFFGGLTHFEIADRIGAPVGTVKARIRRGLSKLSSVLALKS